MSESFAGLGVRQSLLDILHRNGLTTPTPIQQKAIPALLSGRDVIAQAQTGTGKTLAFVLPILEMIDTRKPDIQALILTPTRELAIQITGEIQKLAPIVNAKVLAAYGGQDVEAQIRKLNGAIHIVVATPGRLLDHLRRGTVHLDHVSMLVLDEADQMLQMGFLSEVEDIVRQTPNDRQMLLFSATMPQPIRQLAAKYMRAPEDIRVQNRQVTLTEIRQLLVETTDRAKLQTLLDLLREHQPFLAMVFCRTKIRAKNLTRSLQEQGINADELHGDLTQAKREQVMKRFRDAKLQILVATDVAARGLDVEGITHVYNYDIPHDVESYIHRIGRTGRAGQTGIAITFAAPRDRAFVELIENGIGMALERQGGGRLSMAKTSGAGRTTRRSGAGETRAPRQEGRGPSRKGREGGFGRSSRDEGAAASSRGRGGQARRTASGAAAKPARDHFGARSASDKTPTPARSSGRDRTAEGGFRRDSRGEARSYSPDSPPGGGRVRATDSRSPSRKPSGGLASPGRQAASTRSPGRGPNGSQSPNGSRGSTGRRPR